MTNTESPGLKISREQVDDTLYKIGFKGKIYFHIPPWNNRWIPDLYHVFRHYTRVEDPVDADILFSAWCDKTVLYWSRTFGGLKKIFSYVRRFEMWQHDVIKAMDWDQVNGLIFLNKYTHDLFADMHSLSLSAKVSGYIVPQAVDIDAIPFREHHEPTKKIALVASARWEKNYPMVADILFMLPDYHVHRIGLPGDPAYAGVIVEYFKARGVLDRFHDEGHIPAEQVTDWLWDKDYILSTSVSEGCPVNIIEAMAMGIHPVIHAWPGAEDQFPHGLFGYAEEAASIIKNGFRHSDPKINRIAVEQKYSLKNLEKLPRIVEEVSS